jgi:hypothetical protein
MSVSRATSHEITDIRLQQGNVVYATELARRYGDQGIVSTSLNPGKRMPIFRLSVSHRLAGSIKTELYRYWSSMMLFFVVSIMSSLVFTALRHFVLSATGNVWA